MKQIYFSTHVRRFSALVVFSAVSVMTASLYAAAPYETPASPPAVAPSYVQAGYIQQNGPQVQYPTSISSQTYAQGAQAPAGYPNYGGQNGGASSYTNGYSAASASGNYASQYAAPGAKQAPVVVGGNSASSPQTSSPSSAPVYVPPSQRYGAQGATQQQGTQAAAGSPSYGSPSYGNSAYGSQPSVTPSYGVQSGARSATAGSVTPQLATEPVIEGFADQVPLTVALQQILPQGYGYTLGDGVNPGQLVSWRGGRPWNVVLNDVLGQSGLSYNLNDKLVMINGMGAAPTVVAGVPGQPYAAPVPVAPPYAAPYAAPVPVAPPVMAQQPVPVAIAPPMMEVPVAVPQGLPQPEPLQIENPPVFVPQVWEARPGQTLRQLLQEWSARAGVELNWAAEYDYPVMASLNMTGTFEEAVRVLLGGFDAARPTPRARLHYNPAAGQSVLIVEATGNHYGE